MIASDGTGVVAPAPVSATVGHFLRQRLRISCTEAQRALAPSTAHRLRGVAGASLRV
jgi:hypothetical protein